MLINKTIKNRRQKRRRQRGATTVEMALVLPVFFAILFGFIEIGRLSFAVNATQVALIKSTRALSLPMATIEDGEEAAIDYMTRLGYSADNIDITISPSVITPTTKEITMDIQLDMQPLPYPVRRSLTRSRE